MAKGCANAPFLPSLSALRFSKHQEKTIISSREDGVHNPTYRVIKILDLVSEENGNLTMVEISRRTGIPLGTIFPILQTLVQEGYLRCSEGSNAYSIGLRLFLLGSPFLTRDSIYENMRTVMEDLTKETGETSHLAKLDGASVLYIMKIESPQPIRMFSEIGKKLPAYGTGLGKALISKMDKEALKRLYPEGLKPLTKNTITDFDVLYDQLSHSNGFFYECEESNEGIRCIARPILRNGDVVAAISVGIPVFRYTKEKGRLIENALEKASSSLTKMLAFSGSIF